MTIKQLPNFITSLRIAGTVGMIFMNPFSIEFFVIYTLCGVTDVLDGMVARLAKASSEFGAKLDSVADLLFYATMIVKLLPFLRKVFPVAIWCMIWIDVFIRLMSYVVAAVKYKRFASQHTYMNKLTGAAAFAIPYFAILPIFIPFCVVGCTIAGIASLEELVIHIRSQEYRPEVKTLFCKQLHCNA